MKRIHKYLDIRYEKHLKEWDSVIAICGVSGVSKSNLGLHMAEYWYTKLKGICESEDIKHFCLTKEDFVTDLSDCVPFEMTIFDEAGELSSRSALSKFNKSMMIAYQVIRADKIFTILILPELWYLDSFFRNTKIKALFHVYKRGRVACWLSQKVKKLVQLNQSRYLKNYYLVKPDFYDTFPIYKGVMADSYLKMKTSKTRQARLKLKEQISEKSAVNERDLRNAKIKALLEAGLTQRDVANQLGVSQATVNRTGRDSD
jgi:hypothetical protein